MKLSKRTIEILKNFAAINNELFIRRGNVLTTISPVNNLLARAELDTEFTSDFVVGDMRTLLQMIGLMTEPHIRFRRNELVVAEGRKEIKQTEQTLAPVDEADISYPRNKIETMPSVDLTFAVEERDLKDVLNTAHKMKFDRIELLSMEGKVVLMTGGKRTKKGTMMTAGAWMRTLAETPHDFRFSFLTETWKIIPDNYTIELAADGIAHFVGRGIEYWVVVEDDSVFTRGT